MTTTSHFVGEVAVEVTAVPLYARGVRNPAYSVRVWYFARVPSGDGSGSGTATVDVELQRWSDLPERGWHPGNTHIHYDEKEGDPERRLAYDSRVEDLRMTAISVLKRWDLEYATNKFPPGMLNQFTDTHHYVQNGEETRHNAGGTHSPGYGHEQLRRLAVRP